MLQNRQELVIYRLICRASSDFFSPFFFLIFFSYLAKVIVISLWGIFFWLHFCWYKLLFLTWVLSHLLALLVQWAFYLLAKKETQLWRYEQAAIVLSALPSEKKKKCWPNSLQHLLFGWEEWLCFFSFSVKAEVRRKNKILEELLGIAFLATFFWLCCATHVDGVLILSEGSWI